MCIRDSEWLVPRTWVGKYSVNRKWVKHDVKRDLSTNPHKPTGSLWGPEARDEKIPSNMLLSTVHEKRERGNKQYE